jgi:hypothetical protein
MGAHYSVSRQGLQWVKSLKAVGGGFGDEPPTLRADQTAGQYLGFVRLIARRSLT